MATIMAVPVMMEGVLKWGICASLFEETVEPTIRDGALRVALNVECIELQRADAIGGFISISC